MLGEFLGPICFGRRSRLLGALFLSYYNSRSGNYQTQDSSMADWAQRHQEQVQRMTEQMRSGFNAGSTGAASMSTGGRGFSSSMAMTSK
jgi:hypothetical protein